MKSYVFYLVCGMAAVAFLHIIFAVALYYGRVAKLSAAFESDLVVFVLPLLAAFGGYLMVAWWSTLTINSHIFRISFVVVIAITGTLISTVCAMTVAFNKFGT
jgi:hypothetical protein